jgi:hypothetical protein
VIFEAAIGKVTTGVKDESFRQLVEDFERMRSRDKDDLAPILEMLKTEIQKRLDLNA